MVKLEIDISQLTDQERFDFINGFNSLNGVELISGVIVEYLKKWIIDRPNSDVSVKGEKIHDLPEDDINNIMNKYGT